MIKRGVTLIEILMASLFLSLSLLSLYSITTSSNRVTMDTYFECMAVQLAQEPLEVFRSVGFPACTKMTTYPSGKQDLPGNAKLDYPAEAGMFTREIKFLDENGQPLQNTNAEFIQAVVTVYPRTGTQAGTWTMRGKQGITLSALIPRVY